MSKIKETPYLSGRTFLFSIAKGEDLLLTIEHFCKEMGIKNGIITSTIGAVSKATFAIYDQKAKKYVKTVLEKDLEILSIQGNISLYEDRPLIHTHITLADAEGKAYGGHLMAGTIVFACEIFIQELVGEQKIRKTDKSTQLPLWANPVSRK